MTARRLVLLRHAKSDRTGGPPDHQRPLNGRGRRDAPAVGRWLAEQDLAPDVVLVSSAERTQQTWALVAEQLPVAASRVSVEDGAYAASAPALLRLLRFAPADAARVLLVAHNPGMQDLAELLDDGDPSAADAREHLDGGLPTSGLVVLEPAGAWADLAPGGARLLRVAAPRG